MLRDGNRFDDRLGWLWSEGFSSRIKANAAVRAAVEVALLDFLVAGKSRVAGKALANPLFVIAFAPAVAIGRAALRNRIARSTGPGFFRIPIADAYSEQTCSMTAARVRARSDFFDKRFRY